MHPDNWLPLLLYAKIKNLSPLRSIQLGHASQVRREFSVEAMMIIINEYCPTINITRRRFLIEALGEINKVYVNAERLSIAALSEQANRDRKKK